MIAQEQVSKQMRRFAPGGKLLTLPYRVESAHHPAIIIWQLLATGNPWLRGAALLLMKELVHAYISSGQYDYAIRFIDMIKSNDPYIDEDGIMRA